MDMEKLASIFEAVKVMPLRPQDFIVLRTNVRLDAEHAAELHAYIEEVAGHSRILMIDNGANLEVLRFERPQLEPVPAAVATEAAAPPSAHRPLATAPAEPPEGHVPGALAHG